jgi:hypothetical protein
MKSTLHPQKSAKKNNTHTYTHTHTTYTRSRKTRINCKKMEKRKTVLTRKPFWIKPHLIDTEMWRCSHYKIVLLPTKSLSAFNVIQNEYHQLSIPLSIMQNNLGTNAKTSVVPTVLDLNWSYSDSELHLYSNNIHKMLYFSFSQNWSQIFDGLVVGWEITSVNSCTSRIANSHLAKTKPIWPPCEILSMTLPYEIWRYDDPIFFHIITIILLLQSRE